MSTTTKPKRRVLIGKSSPLFTLSKKESDGIKLPIHQCLNRIINSTHTGNDWFNIMFRLLVGEFVIKKFYTDETVEEYNKSLQVCIDIEKKAMLTDHTVWNISADEIESLQAGVESVDALQDTHFRLDLLAAHRYASDIVSKRYKVID